MIRLAIRGYAAGQVQFEEEVVLFKDHVAEQAMYDILRPHARAFAARQLHMLEFELLDEPDPDLRFHRIGTELAPV